MSAPDCLVTHLLVFTYIFWKKNFQIRAVRQALITRYLLNVANTCKQRLHLHQELRRTEQWLAKEYFNFVTGEGPYRNQDEKEAFLNFVDRIENAIASENASTLNVMTTLSEKKAEAPAGHGKDS